MCRDVRALLPVFDDIEHAGRGAAAATLAAIATVKDDGAGVVIRNR